MGPVQGTLWDQEQQRVIEAASGERLLVVAPPGAGKTAVVCARIAHLAGALDVTPSHILVVSFTRTAVAEIRNRVRALGSPEIAARVEIATLDSISYRWREGFEEAADKHTKGAVTYDSNLKRLGQLLEHGHEGLTEHLQLYEHVLVDEAQDIVGTRAELVDALLRRLDPKCGVTVLCDPHQAIYGFTSDADDSAASVAPAALIDLLAPHGLTRIELRGQHRTTDPQLLELLRDTRKDLDAGGPGSEESLARLADLIASRAAATGRKPDLSELKSESSGSVLALFRRRSDVLMASSYLSSREKGSVAHRLRLGGMTPPVFPWIAYLLGNETRPFLSAADLASLWEAHAHPLLEGVVRDDALALLLRFGRDGRHFSLKKLREVIARVRPPVELCATELGTTGPILSTIHASKGREAETVWLFLPKNKATEPTADDSVELPLDTAQVGKSWDEERRVLYVGATRARQRLEVGRAFRRGGGSLESGRVYAGHTTRGRSAFQMHVGLDGDVRLRPETSDGAQKIDVATQQALLASFAASTRSVHAKYSHDARAYQLLVEAGSREHAIGYLTKQVNDDLWELARRAGRDRPWTELNHLYLVGLGTVAIADDLERQKLPVPYRESGLLLQPIIKGWSYLPCGWKRPAGSR